jgi:hypothetical protein
VRHIPRRRIANRIQFHVFPKGRYVPKESHARVLRRNIGTSITGQRHFTPGSSPELPKARTCYRRQPFAGSARRRDYFLKVFEEVRQKYDLVVWGYVVMPEHFHILISEPAKGNVARVMQVLKQELSRACVKRRNRPIR